MKRSFLTSVLDAIWTSTTANKVKQYTTRSQPFWCIQLNHKIPSKICIWIECLFFIFAIIFMVLWALILAFGLSINHCETSRQRISAKAEAFEEKKEKPGNCAEEKKRKTWSTIFRCMRRFKRRKHRGSWRRPMTQTHCEWRVCEREGQNF